MLRRGKNSLTGVYVSSFKNRYGLLEKSADVFPAMNKTTRSKEHTPVFAFRASCEEGIVEPQTCPLQSHNSFERKGAGQSLRQFQDRKDIVQLRIEE